MKSVQQIGERFPFLLSLFVHVVFITLPQAYLTTSIQRHNRPDIIPFPSFVGNIRDLHEISGAVAVVVSKQEFILDLLIVSINFVVSAHFAIVVRSFACIGMLKAFFLHT